MGDFVRSSRKGPLLNFDHHESDRFTGWNTVEDASMIDEGRVCRVWDVPEIRVSSRSLLLPAPEAVECSAAELF